MNSYGATHVRLWLAALMVGLPAVVVLHAQPTLVSVTPPNGTVDYDVTQPVVFTFSEEMFPVLPVNIPGVTSFLQWTGLGSVPVEYAWDDASMILSCTFPENLPGHTQLAWTLNPPGAFFPLTSLFGEVLPTTSGSFTTGEGQAPCDPDGIPDTYGIVTLQKHSAYVQNAESIPAPSNEISPLFGAIVESPDADGVTAVTLQPPGGDPQPMASTSGFFSFLEEFATETELDGAHPGGTYVIEVTQLIAGTSAVSLNMPPGFPPIPQIVNYTAAQSIPAAADFTLTWNPFTGVLEEDSIILEIHDLSYQTVFEAPDLCAGLDLANTDTSITIPAGTLQVGQTYLGTLTFYRVFHRSAESLSDFGVFGSVLRSTEFTLKTSGGSVATPPDLSAVSFPAGGPLSFTVNDLQIGTAYVVESSPTAEPGSWTQLSRFTANATQAPVTDVTAEQAGTRFYRVVAEQ